MASDFLRQSNRGPSARDKALNTLSGILKGVTADGVISKREIQELSEWCNDHEHLIQTHPFTEMLPMLRRHLTGNELQTEDFRDIQWLAENSKVESTYYDGITAKIQELHGVFHGILADGIINQDELARLRAWIVDNDDLKGVYPYDEVESLVFTVAHEGSVSPDDHATILNFFETFISYSLSKRISDGIKNARLGNPKSKTITGVCAIDPTITFQNKLFVFTGTSERAKRDDIFKQVEERGGKNADRIVQDIDYLVVGNGGNRAWAYACYGRKIEQAVNMRKNGHHLQIVNEVDFWDALNK